MKLLHRIYALSWILVLLFALSGKSYHVLIEHHEEEVCGNSETHYHEKEHSCFICEFELKDNALIFNHFEFQAEYSIKYNYFASLTQAFVEASYYDKNPRGPPML